MSDEKGDIPLGEAFVRIADHAAQWQEREGERAYGTLYKLALIAPPLFLAAGYFAGYVAAGGHIP